MAQIDTFAPGAPGRPAAGDGTSRAAGELWAMAHLGTPMAIRTAATLRIADHIVRGVRTAGELAEVTGTDADAMDRLLCYLVDRRVLCRDPAGGFGLCPVGEALRDDHPGGMRAMLDLDSAVGRAELAFVDLPHSIRTGEAAYPVRFGRDFWTDMAQDPGRQQSFDSRMSAYTPERAPAVVNGFDWGSLGSLVDVGGGNGSLLVAILQSHPALRATLVDQPATAATARDRLAEAGLDDRADAVAGSFFDPLPAGSGAYLLSLILHDWADAAAEAILRRCADAAGAGGTVLVIEDLGTDGESPRSGMNLRMLVYYGGKERGLAELAALGARCGLALTTVHPAGDLSIVEFVVT